MAEERPFTDPKREPTDAAVRAALKGAAAHFAGLMERGAAYPREWGHSKASGWMLKVHDRKKALFYVVPLAGSFRVSLSVRPAERDALLADDRVVAIHEQLGAAKKYVEGYALRFDVADRKAATVVADLVARILELRAATRRT